MDKRLLAYDRPKKRRIGGRARRITVSDEERRAYEEQIRLRVERDAADGKPPYAPYKAKDKDNAV